MPRWLLWLLVIFELLVLIFVFRHVRTTDRSSGTPRDQRPPAAQDRRSEEEEVGASGSRRGTRRGDSPVHTRAGRDQVTCSGSRADSGVDEHERQGRDTCGICMENITDRCVLNPCMHAFDGNCISHWFRVNLRHTCPVCRHLVDFMYTRIRSDGGADEVRSLRSRARA